ncbi:hypothetical protein BTJ66_11955 [Staphylococcus edaphicus]|uniref:Uncharacterized protein n=1 Tax=Staphylococcus edaphicus TaxID=1955013 RepID=A0A2C6WLS3_9STAP|nr:hypothetical protein BTJ66_11955 [Staphylococcus edaphicus]
MAFGAETIILKQNKVVKCFYTKGALTKDSALSYDNLQISNKRTFYNLIKVGVIVKVNHKYYLSENTWQTFKHSLRRFLLI